MYPVLFSLLILSSVACQTHPRVKVESFLNNLADPAVSTDGQEQALQSIVLLGTKAIPILIEHLNDQRPVGMVADWPPGECFNLPPHQPVPESCLTVRGHMQILGEKCEELLYGIITPDYRSPEAQGRDRGKAGMGPPFVVADLSLWWKRHQDENIEIFHAQARKLIDEFWKRGWELGPVVWE